MVDKLLKGETDPITLAEKVAEDICKSLLKNNL